MTANDRLAKIKARAEAATEGPWEWGQGDLCHLGGYVAGPPIHYEALWANRPVDAAFISHARTDVPALVAALEAVLDLHKPVNVEPCDTICGECSFRFPNGTFMPTVEHPCPTVEAINEALGENQ